MLVVVRYEPVELEDEVLLARHRLVALKLRQWSGPLQWCSCSRLFCRYRLRLRHRSLRVDRSLDILFKVGTAIVFVFHTFTNDEFFRLHILCPLVFHDSLGHYPAC